MNSQLVSIIMPAYNSEEFIENSIESIVNQTYMNWELFVIDDLSIDSTVKIVIKLIEKFPDKSIELIKLEENSGAAVARNRGISRANGKYLAFLDSDDLWLPQKLEKQVNFMEEKEYIFTYSNYDVIGINEGLPKKTIRPPNSMTYNSLLKNTAIGCLTVMINKEKLPYFEMPLIRAGQDTAAWLRVLKQGITAHNLNESLALYRKRNGSISRNKFKAPKRTWKIYREVENLNFFKSVYYFCCYALNGLKKSF